MAYGQLQCQGSLHVPALLMEFAGAGTLRQFLKTYRPIPEGAVSLLVRDVCEGLAAAHTCGTMRRDLKLEHVLLVKDKGKGRLVAKVADFGLSKENWTGGSNTAQSGTKAGSGVMTTVLTAMH